MKLRVPVDLPGMTPTQKMPCARFRYALAAALAVALVLATALAPLASAASSRHRARRHRPHLLTRIVTPPSSVPFPPGVTASLLYSDNFSETALSPFWKLYNGPGNAGFGLRRPSAISLDGQGDLVIAATMQSGEVVSGGMALRINQTYGRFEFRVRTDPDPSGTTSAVVLTWPQSENWPIDGESDMYETKPNPSRNFFQSAIHYGTTNQQVLFHSNVDATQWHTVIMDWTPSAITLYRDGILIGTTSAPAAVPHVPQHLCIQLDAMNSNTLVQPVRMYVDYVKVYSFS